MESIANGCQVNENNLSGSSDGACFMVGGKEEGIKKAEPILVSLSVNKDGYVHTGVPGSGHFTKLVHNGIEFGMVITMDNHKCLIEL